MIRIHWRAWRIWCWLRPWTVPHGFRGAWISLEGWHWYWDCCVCRRKWGDVPLPSKLSAYDESIARAMFLDGMPTDADDPR